MSFADIIKKPPPASLYDGQLVADVAALTDLARVVLPSFDRELEWEAPWMPRVNTTGGLVLPRTGDRCIAALAETEDPGLPEVWIIGWWPF